MTLHAEWTDEELPELHKLLNRALNTSDPATTPKWAWQLEARVVAKLNDLKRDRQRATLIAAIPLPEHSTGCLSVGGGNNDDTCICGATFRYNQAIIEVESQL